MKRLACSFMLATTLIATSGASQTKTYTGYIMDLSCGAGRANDKDFEKIISNHSTMCALMKDCMESGYGILFEGKFYRLDANGNKLAVAILKATKTKKGVRVTAEGTIEGDTLKVTSMSEEKPPPT